MPDLGGRGIREIPGKAIRSLGRVPGQKEAADAVKCNSLFPRQQKCPRYQPGQILHAESGRERKQDEGDKPALKNDWRRPWPVKIEPGNRPKDDQKNAFMR
jgi:hypothetical protein